MGEVESGTVQKTEAMRPKKKKPSSFRIPHTYIILGIILILCTLLTYVVPAGEFQRVEDPESGRMIAVPGSYQRVEQAPVSPFGLFIAIQEGMIGASDIIFFIFFAYAFVHVTLATGALDAAVGAMLRRLKGTVLAVIPIFMIAFGIMGATFGLYEEVYGLIPVFLGIFMSLGFDAITGGAIVVVGVATGFAAAITNPFTIGVAQGIAGLPLFSGIGLRIAVFIVFEAAAIGYTMHYAVKVKKDPTRSAVYGDDFSHLHFKDPKELEQVKFTTVQKVVMILFALTIVTIVAGTLTQGWYINEIAAVFIIGTLVVGLVGGFGFSGTASLFVEGVGTVIFGALVVGMARSVLIVMENGLIIDTIVYSLAGLLSGTSRYVSAIGMVFIQNAVNFFIPSGSGQAATTMPIMAPVADMLGLNRQIAVLAYQFGDGFSNMFWPTAVATECGLMGISVPKWYKFMGKLFLIFLSLQVIFICVAVAVNYS